MPQKKQLPRYVHLTVRCLRTDYELLMHRARLEGHLSTASFIRTLLAPILVREKNSPSAPSTPR